MCGFVGEYVFGGGRADLELVRRLAGRLRHRGPDEEGSFLSPDGKCAIGFRRLIVIDPAGSRQPMASPDGQTVLAFNGEVYNFRKLRMGLSAEGAKFSTAGDTEVVLQQYIHGRRKSLDCSQIIAGLEGMFAIAIYSADDGLLLARDRMGQKPLWYAALSDRIVFASEAKALLSHPRVDKKIDKEAISYYFTIGYIPASYSVWQAIRKLPAGNFITVAGEKILQPQRYWQINSDPAASASARQESPQDRAQRVRQAVRQAVESHIVSDVPLGVLLSGGIDSSIVTAVMSQIAGRAGGVRSFTAGFADERFDERPAARLVAEHCRTQHVELLVEARPEGLLEKIVGMYDEPFGDSSAIPTHLICQAARQHVTVALGGDGGDEVFGGYDRYRAMMLGERIGPLRYWGVRLAALLARPFAGKDERGTLRRFLRFADALPYPPAHQYFIYRRLFSPSDLEFLLADGLVAELDVEKPARWFCDLYEDCPLDSELGRAQWHDMMTYLSDDLLVKTDIASMACSLELRSPMLDRSVVELGLSLPDDAKIRRGRGKAILRLAFADLLPAEVFGRPKRGFAVPLGDWLKGPLRQTMLDTLLDKRIEQLGFFHKEALAGLINDHLCGRDDHRHRLWTLMVLCHWLANQT
ncbi:MAG: asparagine synthase (glutamine-hydrolyzing) [Planctomycetes bacterium]|nr:asparagine synthase (glutamine-hydrolyzing) [Planctomycetota bacterium]